MRCIPIALENWVYPNPVRALTQLFSEPQLNVMGITRKLDKSVGWDETKWNPSEKNWNKLNRLGRSGVFSKQRFLQVKNIRPNAIWNLSGGARLSRGLPPAIPSPNRSFQGTPWRVTDERWQQKSPQEAGLWVSTECFAWELSLAGGWHSHYGPLTLVNA